jgi:hypothetical protein
MMRGQTLWYFVPRGILLNSDEDSTAMSMQIHTKRHIRTNYEKKLFKKSNQCNESANPDTVAVSSALLLFSVYCISVLCRVITQQK